MRFRSNPAVGYRVYAVTGTNVASFAIEIVGADTTGLHGFSIYRVDVAAGKEFWMYGFKVFPSVIKKPTEKTTVTTDKHPVQSFVWDDFNLEPDRVYEYRFYPRKGNPKKMDPVGTPVKIRIRTEPLYSANAHDVYFNRGIASSQSYARKFQNKPPDKLTPLAKQLEAWEWLSRSLDDALFRFVDQAQAGDTILGCFYEFHYGPVLERLKAARDRGVQVRLIVDCKENAEAFPRDANLAALAAAGIPLDADLIQRKARTNAIQHNKFMVLLRSGTAAEVWTGSTNISQGGIFGQTNVGHWTRDANVAGAFRSYWELLAQDPGANGNSAAARAANRKFRDDVEAIVAVPAKAEDISAGTTPVFSPRTGLQVLDLYERLLDEAQRVGCITLAFGIGAGFKERLQDNTGTSPLLFLLLEKKDVKNPKSTKPFVPINAKNNAYKAWGAFIDNPVYQWAREVNTKKLGLNRHVAYIHSKFLLQDPLGDDPVVVTGSANFSAASTNDNDENMLLIRGDKRVADLYFTEFNRLFHHYYFRSVWEDLHKGTAKPKPTKAQDAASLFLVEDGSWLANYEPGKIRTKRVRMLVDMKGLSPQPT